MSVLHVQQMLNVNYKHDDYLDVLPASSADYTIASSETMAGKFSPSAPSTSGVDDALRDTFPAIVLERSDGVVISRSGKDVDGAPSLLLFFSSPPPFQL